MYAVGTLYQAGNVPFFLQGSCRLLESLVIYVFKGFAYDITIGLAVHAGIFIVFLHKGFKVLAGVYLVQHFLRKAL